MEANTKKLEALLEREQIRDCIVRLARGEDRRDAQLISASTGATRRPTTVYSSEPSTSISPGSCRDRRRYP